MKTKKLSRVDSEAQICDIVSRANGAQNLKEVWRVRAWAAGAFDFLADRAPDANYISEDCVVYKADAYRIGREGYVPKSMEAK